MWADEQGGLVDSEKALSLGIHTLSSSVSELCKFLLCSEQIILLCLKCVRPPHGEKDILAVQISIKSTAPAASRVTLTVTVTLTGLKQVSTPETAAPKSQDGEGLELPPPKMGLHPFIFHLCLCFEAAQSQGTNRHPLHSSVTSASLLFFYFF